MEPIIQVLAQNSDSEAAAAAAVMGIGLFAAVGAIVVGLLISAIVTWLIWDSYKAVPQQFQKLPAGLVWLGLVPCLGLLVYLAVAILVPMAFKDAFASKGRSEFGDCGQLFGIAFIVCAVLSIIPFIGLIFSLGSLVCMILFIVKLRQMKAAMLTA